MSLEWWVEQQLLPLAGMTHDNQRAALMNTWARLGGTARFVFNKLITGAFRVGVSDGLVVRALAQVSGISAETIAHRLMGQWEPSAAWYVQLIGTETTDADWSRPYPFLLAYPLTDEPASLGDVAEWQIEWKWDGIRAQLVRRRGRTFLWSRGEELLAGRFPEIETAAEWLPDGTVLDGELLAWRDGTPLPFSELQRRIGRKTVGKKLLSDVPAHLRQALGVAARGSLRDAGRRAVLAKDPTKEAAPFAGRDAGARRRDRRLHDVTAFFGGAFDFGQCCGCGL